jgi:hypothetical protein
MRTALSLAVVVVSLWSAPAWGQSATTGALSGTARKAQDAPIPGVAVTLINSATQRTQQTVTGANGGFQFSLLPPGVYDVTFAAPGFKTARMRAANVSVSESAILDATLEPGAASEEVACRCQLSVADTSSTGTLVDHRTITSVPLTTRNYTQILSLSSGSAADVNNAGSLGRGTQSVNVNGNTSSGGSALDGANAPSSVPNPDSIREVKIQTSQYDASYGAQVPSTNLITKSGENDMHGSAWEFVRNDILNANSFFRNATGQRKPVLKQNQFGATLGGPVLKNKIFYFGSYQGTRQSNAFDATSSSNPILPALTHDRSVATLAAQFCPANHLLGNGQPDSRYFTFAGGKQLDCYNRSTDTTAPISPVALRLLQAKRPDGSYYIPVPQTILTSGSNAGLGFSTYSLPSTYDENQILMNLDYLVSQSNMLSARGYLTRFDQYRSFASPSGYPGAPILPGEGTPQKLKGKDYVATLRLTSSLSAQMVNEARMSFTRNGMFAWGEGTPTAASIGITPGNPLFPQPPEVSILGPLGTFRLYGTVGNNFNTLTDTYSWSDNLSLVRKNHTLRTGVTILMQELNRQDTGSARGKITFQTFSDFLIGLGAAGNLSPLGRSNVDSVSINRGVGPNGEVQYIYRTFYGSGFVQDDFKIRPNLTLNFGLRWEFMRPTVDSQGTLGNVWPSLLAQMPIPPASGTLIGYTVAANYDPNMMNPTTGKPFGPAPTGVFVRPYGTSYANRAPLDAFAPRAGFAWQPKGSQGRLALRGGYGWFYQSVPISGTTNGTPSSSAPPFAQAFTNTASSNGASTFVVPFPVTTLGWVLRTPTSALSDTVAGSDFTLPLLQQWNVNAQTRLTKTLSIDVGYVGSHGSRLLSTHGLNQPMLASETNPVNCGYDGDPSHCITTNTAQNARLRVPFLGETPTALAAAQFIGTSAYRSLQVTLRRRAANSLSFQAAYTLSRAESNTVIYNDQNRTDFDMGRTSFDRAQRLIANFDYSFPFLGRLGSGKSPLLKGWTLSGITTIQSGTPLTLTDPKGGSVFGRAGNSTVTLCPGASSSALATSGSIAERLSHWINTSQICSATVAGSDGSTGYGNTGLGILDGPGQWNLDFSLTKNTVVGGLRESATLVFRAEFYNAFNHAQFSNPGTTLGTATFGVVTGTSVAPRLIQFGLKYLF